MIVPEGIDAEGLAAKEVLLPLFPTFFHGSPEEVAMRTRFGAPIAKMIAVGSFRGEQ